MSSSVSSRGALRRFCHTLIAGYFVLHPLAPARAAAPSGKPLRVEVRVVEVAGGRAYLASNAEQNLRVGDLVQIGRRRYAVIARNGKHAVIALGPERLERGRRGSAQIRVVEAETFAARERPRPLQAFAGRWLPPRLPAESQAPRHVPLGVMAEARKHRLILNVDHQRIQPLSGPAFAIGRTRLRALLHAELPALPLTLDADGYAELWQSSDLDQRPENASRPLLNVRQLELGYRGEVAAAAVGRLRYAARTVGMLDGARASAALSEDWSLAAFGGTLADPRDGSVATDASRFGVEVGWQAADAPARPSASLTLQGSRYLGRNDERRISTVIEAYPEFGRVGARAEVSLFDVDNPWAAAPLELSAAGADVSVKIDALRIALNLDMRRPERSLWLAAFLPVGYFCVEGSVPGSLQPTPCVDSAERYSALGTVAWEAPLWTLDAGATLTTSRGVEADQTTLFSSFRRREIVSGLRLDTGVTLSRGSLLESAALDVAVGSLWADETLDLSMHYRPSVLRYRAGGDDLVEHGVGLRSWWGVVRDFDLNGSVELVTGGDVEVLLLHVGATFRL